MAEDDTNPFAGLPPGDEDPNLIYSAVGRAIHRWENMEQGFAALYLTFVGKDQEPQNYFAFGDENGTFVKRMAALVEAAEKYFAAHPDQHKEGEFQRIVKRVQELSIERHRIAHGHMTQGGPFKIPPLSAGENFTITAKLGYRWAPPFYGVVKLRTSFIGNNAATIEATSLQFEYLHNEVAALNRRLVGLPPLPQRPLAQ